MILYSILNAYLCICPVYISQLFSIALWEFLAYSQWRFAWKALKSHVWLASGCFQWLYIGGQYDYSGGRDELSTLSKDGCKGTSIQNGNALDWTFVSTCACGSPNSVPPAGGRSNETSNREVCWAAWFQIRWMVARKPPASIHWGKMSTPTWQCLSAVLL